MINNNYKNKYLKYKNKYINLKNSLSELDQIGGALGLCKICKLEKKLQKCSKCKYVAYCSTECQKQDWTEHKEKCIKIAKAAEQIVNPEDLKTTNPDEFRIRTTAVEAITDFYSILNTKFDFSSELISYSINYAYPGFNRFPLPQIQNEKIKVIKIKDTYVDDHYKNLELYPVPLFNKTSTELGRILRFDSITGPNPNHIMDCTNAFGMVQFAIMHKLIPDYTIQLLNNSVLDQVVLERTKQDHFISQLNGYHRKEEIKKLQIYYVNGILTDAQLSGINNVLLTPQKDKRLFVIHTYRKEFFNIVHIPTKLNIGNGYGIQGHPNYLPGIMGNHPSENVFCVSFTSEAEPLFIGYTGNKINRPGIRPICDFSHGPVRLSVIQHFLAVEYVKGLFVLDSIDFKHIILLPEESQKILKLNLLILIHLRGIPKTYDDIINKELKNPLIIQILADSEQKIKHLPEELQKILISNLSILIYLKLMTDGNITDDQLKHPEIKKIIAEFEKEIKALPVQNLAILNINSFINPSTLPEIDTSKMKPDDELQSDVSNEVLIAEIKKS